MPRVYITDVPLRFSFWQRDIHHGCIYGYCMPGIYVLDVLRVAACQGVGFPNFVRVTLHARDLGLLHARDICHACI